MVLERKLVLDNGVIVDSDGFVSVLCLFDMGCQKSGWGYNFFIGYRVVMGLIIVKVLDFVIKIKICRICNNVI